MAENADDPKLRELIKTGVKIAAGGAVAGTVGIGIGAFAGNEVKKVLFGIETSSGIFFPLYERHDIGISPRDIAADTDIYFREISHRPESNVTLMDAQAEEILQVQGQVYEGTTLQSKINAFPDEILKKVSQNKTKVMLADITLNKFYSQDIYNPLLATYGASSGLGAMLTLLSEFDLKNTKVSRRKFLAILGSLGILWGAPPTFAQAADTFGLGMTDKEQTVAKRINSRFRGITSDFHPENANEFFRNAVIADKLLTVGRLTHSEKGNLPPKIAFHVEGGHSGIEDFLQLGPDIYRAVILSHPKSFLWEAVVLNGGVDKFCMSRLIKLSEFSPSKIVVANEQRIVDPKLKSGLEQKLK